jgi:biopolymer transport protein ExbB
MLKYLFDGGPLMVPLLACSILTLAVLVDRLWVFLQNSKYDTRSLRAKILDLMGDGRVDDAALLCASTPSPVSAVLLTGLQSYAKHRDLVDRPDALTAVMDKAMDDYSLHAMSAVEKRFAILATMGSAAPLLGFTGTVTGMIAAFAEMAGAGDPKIIAAGISEALITTAAGLLIALAAVIPYNVFLGMANKIDLEIEEAKSEILDFIATRAGAR